MVDYQPVSEITNDRTAQEEHDTITGVVSNPNYFAGVVKAVDTGELRHVAFEREPPDGVITALQNQYGVTWEKSVP